MAKTEKICIVCGTKFMGTAKAQVCTDKSNCRVKLKRMLEKGEKPPFALIAAVKKETSSQKEENTQVEKEVKKTAPESTTTSFVQKKFMSNQMLEIRKKKLGLT